jgi:CDGSH-type Zn-finger protein
MPPEIRITKNGPYLVSGDLPLAQVNIGTNAQGESVRWEWGRKFQDQARYALCRCGGSANKPYCDGTHTKIDFDGTETASRKPSNVLRATARVTFWGALAMALTAGIGKLFGTVV